MNSLRITVEFLDEQGAVLLADDFGSVVGSGGMGDPYTLRLPVTYRFGESDADSNFFPDFERPEGQIGVFRLGRAFGHGMTQTIFLSPYFGWFSTGTRYAVASHIRREMKVSVADVRRIKKVRARVSSDIPLPPDPAAHEEALERSFIDEK